MQLSNINSYQPSIPTITGSDMKTSDMKKLKKETDAFEAIIIKMMLDKAIKADDPLLPKDPGRKIYQSMQNDQMSKELSGSFGYSELLFNYLTHKRG